MHLGRMLGRHHSSRSRTFKMALKFTHHFMMLMTPEIIPVHELIGYTPVSSLAKEDSFVSRISYYREGRSKGAFGHADYCNFVNF
jgi:hypothetical protein